jgi:arylsulfatase A-like enzyme
VRRNALLSVLALAGFACAPKAPPGGEETTIHLLPLLGTAQPTRVPRPSEGSAPEDLGGPSDLTRPALTLRSGEAKGCTVFVPPQSQLVFALALGGPGPKDLSFEVRLGGRSVLKETLSAKRWNMWTPFAVPLGVAGRTEVSFEGRIDSQNPPAIFLASVRLERAPPKRPPTTLIWISQDALGADHLGAYGYGRTTSPQFDRLAEKSVVFEDAVAPATWTLPSLASQFTSRYPPFHGAVLQESARDPSTPTLFEILSKNGFTVLGVSGNRYVGPDFQMADGFDALWYSPGHADELARLALAATDEWKGGDLALFVHFMDTHFPYEPPTPYAQAFDPHYRGAITGRNFFEARKRLTPADVAHVKALYDGAARFADAEIAGLLSGLEARGLLRNAFLVYSADHGEGFLEHGRLLHAGTVYRELTHVPLALRFPGTAPARIPQVVSLIDLAPTLLDALGIPRPPSFQGRSLTPLLRGASLPEIPAYSETQVTNNNAFWKVAVTDARFRLIVKTPRQGPAVGFAQEEFFDRSADPWEQHPIAKASEEEALERRATAYFEGARAHAAHGATAAIPRDVQDRLRALGYLAE